MHKWLYSEERPKLDTASEWFEEDTYIDHGGKKYIRRNGQNEIKGAGEDVTGLTKANIIGSNYVSVFLNEDTQEIVEDSITEAEYRSLGEKGAGPAIKK